MNKNTRETQFKFTSDSSGAVTGFRKIENAAGKLYKESVRINQSFEGMRNVLGLVTGAARTAWSTLEEGARISEISTGFDRISRSANIVSEILLGDMRKAVRGTMSDLQMMTVANQALIAGMDPQMITTALSYLRAYSKQTGKDFEQLTSTIFTGLTRGSTQLLDDAGIIISQTGLMKQKTEEYGRELTDTEKRQILLSEAMRQMQEKLPMLGGEVDSASDKFARFRAEMQNVSDESKNMLMTTAAESWEGVKFWGKYFKDLNDLGVQGVQWVWERGQNVSNSLQGALAASEGLISWQEYINANAEELNALLNGGVSGLDELEKGYEAAEKAAQKAYEADVKRIKALAASYITTPQYTDPKAQEKLEKLLSAAQLAKMQVGLDGYAAAVMRIKAEYEDMDKSTAVLKNLADKWLSVSLETAKATETLRKNNEEKRAAIELAKQMGREDTYDIDRGATNWGQEQEADRFGLTLMDKIKEAERQLFVNGATDYKSKQRIQVEFEYEDMVMQAIGDERIIAAADEWKALQYEIINTADAMTEATATFQRELDSQLVVASAVKDVMSGVTAELAESVIVLSETGKFAVDDLFKNIYNVVKTEAVQKAMSLTIEGLYQQYIAGVYTAASVNPANVALAGQYKMSAAAAQVASTGAFAGAALFGSIAAGTLLGGLVGQAHDGWFDLPETGTYYAKAGESIIDESTTQMFKKGKFGGGMTINMGGITINGGDEKGVLKALPEMKKQIVSTMVENIANNGEVRKAIKRYV